MTGGSITAAGIGVICLLVGLFLSWNREAPWTRTVLLLVGATSVTGGIFGDITGRISDTVDQAGKAITQTVTGNAVGFIGLILIALYLVRGVIQRNFSRWTDAACVLVPPLGAAAGGLIWAICLLIAGITSWGIGAGWDFLGNFANTISKGMS